MQREIVAIVAVASFLFLHAWASCKLIPFWVPIVFAAGAAVAGGCFIQPVSPYGYFVLVIGTALGFLLFTASCITAGRDFINTLRQFSVPSFNDSRPIFKQLFYAWWEELFWRVTILNFIAVPSPVFFLICLMFSFAHYPRVRRVRGFVDLFLTAILLSIAYLWFNDLWLVVVAHWTRNIFIMCSRTKMNKAQKSSCYD